MWFLQSYYTYIQRNCEGKKKSKTSFIPAGAGRNMIKGYCPLWWLFSLPQENHTTLPFSPHFKLPWTQNHPQRSSKATHKSSWRLYNTSLVYWYQPAWLRWFLSEPIPPTPWMVAVSRGGKTAGICILTQKFTLCGGPCWWVFLSGTRSANSYQVWLKMWKFYHVASWAWNFSS